MSVAIFSLIGVQFYFLNVSFTQYGRIQSFSINKCLEELVESINEREKAQFTSFLRSSKLGNSEFSVDKNSISNAISKEKLSEIVKKVLGSDTNRILSNDIKNIGLISEEMYINLFQRIYLDNHFLFFTESVGKKVEYELQEIFLDKGIQTPFALVLFETKTSNLLFQSERFTSLKNNEKVFERKLFRSSEEKDSPKILLYMKSDLEGQGLSQMIFLFVISFTLLVVIIICFVTTIYIVVSQKKIALMKSDFINNMTHEFKTPITTISLATQMLAEAESLPPKKIVQFSNIIQDENQRLANFVDRILQTSVHEKGKVNLKVIPLKMNTIISELSQKTRKLNNRKNLKFEVFLEATSDHIRGDEIHLTNVITNLIENGIKYSKDVPQIIVRTYNKENMLCISVQDFGIGISKKYHHKIFDELFRVPQGDTHDFKGFGLGLSYVKKIVEKHEGVITVKSEQGKGSTFTIKLPCNTELS